MGTDEKEYVAVVVNFFWGEGTAESHSINERVAEIVYEALLEAQSCSASMDLVPRPSSGVAGASYIITQIAMIGKRMMSGDTAIYNACKYKVGVNYKTAINLALMGI